MKEKVEKYGFLGKYFYEEELISKVRQNLTEERALTSWKW